MIFLSTDTLVIDDTTDIIAPMCYSANMLIWLVVKRLLMKSPPAFVFSFSKLNTFDKDTKSMSVRILLSLLPFGGWKCWKVQNQKKRKRKELL